jgi:hypothetical protein
MVLEGFSSIVAERGFIFRNDNGIMTAVDSSIVKVSSGTVNFADYDNDGDEDLLINGQNNGGPVTQLYRNDSSVFVPVQSGFRGIIGVTRWIDFDNDGFMDVISSGLMDSTFNDTTLAYRNNGNGTFSFFPTNIAVADYDHDSLPDVFITGTDAFTFVEFVALFHNNGGGNFSMDTATFTQLSTGMAKWGDVDSDGDLDIVYDGIKSDNSAYTLIYLNDGSGNFAEQPTNLPGTGEPGSVDLADIDHDGDLDVLLSENLFRNDGSGNFTDVSPWPPQGVFAIPAQFMDYDQDGDDDIFMLAFFGINNSDIFRNELITGINNLPDNAGSLSVYPNPAASFINLPHFKDQISEVRIYSTDGKMVFDSQKEKSQIDISGLVPGIYFVKVMGDESEYAYKIVHY